MSEYFEFRPGGIEDASEFIDRIFGGEHTGIGAQLARAIGNQSDLARMVAPLDPEVSERCSITMSRYRAWASHAVHKLDDAMDFLIDHEDNKEALQLIKEVGVSLKAFVAAQDQFVEPAVGEMPPLKHL